MGINCRFITNEGQALVTQRLEEVPVIRGAWVFKKDLYTVIGVVMVGETELGYEITVRPNYKTLIR